MIWVYFLIAGGFMEATGRFWLSLAWPVYLGKMMGQEAIKRGVFE